MEYCGFQFLSIEQFSILPLAWLTLGKLILVLNFISGGLLG